MWRLKLNSWCLSSFSMLNPEHLLLREGSPFATVEAYSGLGYQKAILWRIYNRESLFVVSVCYLFPKPEIQGRQRERHKQFRDKRLLLPRENFSPHSTKYFILVLEEWTWAVCLQILSWLATLRSKQLRKTAHLATKATTLSSIMSVSTTIIVIPLPSEKIEAQIS